MIGGPKSAGGFSIASFNKIGEQFKAPEVGKAVQELKGAVEQLAKNPLMRQLLGESSFEGQGAQGKGKALGHAKQAERAGEAGEAGEKATTPEEGLKKLVDGLKKFIEALEEMLGKKPAKGGEEAGGAGAAEGAGGAGGAGGGEGAGGAGGAGGGEAAGGAGGAGGAEGAGGAGGAEGAGAAEGAGEEEDPISQLLKALTGIIEQLQQLQQKLGAQAGNGNTGIVPQGATTGTNTGIVPPTV